MVQTTNQKELMFVQRRKNPGLDFSGAYLVVARKMAETDGNSTCLNPQTPPGKKNKCNIQPYHIIHHNSYKTEKLRAE